MSGKCREFPKDYNYFLRNIMILYRLYNHSLLILIIFNVLKIFEKVSLHVLFFKTN